LKFEYDFPRLRVVLILLGVPLGFQDRWFGAYH
jgi:hypothetical protein